MFRMSAVHLSLCLLWSVSVAKDYYGTKGSNITLVCTNKALAGRTLQWSYIYPDVSTTIYSQNDRINTGYSNRLSVTGNYNNGEYNLQIHDIRESDEGTYKCEIQGIVGQDKHNLSLIVVPSSVTIQDVTDNKILGNEGQSLTLRCNAAGGKPPPLVTITVDNVPRSSEQSVAYTIPTLQRLHDKLVVRCDANSPALNSPLVANAVLNLNLKPLQPIFSMYAVSTEETKPLVVNCTSYGSRPQAIFKWMIGQATLTSGITTTHVLNTADDTYTVTSSLTYSVNRNHNGQTLTCGAYNNLSTSGVLTSTTLDVKFAPYVIVSNETYSQEIESRIVTCKAVGNPTVYTYYRWQHKSIYGVLIRELDEGQDGVLRLPSVPVEARYQDSGEYVCTASNGITGRDGKTEQSGSGYVTVNAMPEFTIGNTIKYYGQFGKDVDIHVYVNSVPKYTSLQWYKFNTVISQNFKYTLSEAATMVTDTLHGTIVQLDGYKVTLTIKNLMESDFNVTYRVELSNGVGRPVVYTTLLVYASHPQTPLCFVVPSSSESSVLLQWEPADNGGHEQTFYAEYRVFGSNAWLSVKVPNTKQTGRQNYTLNGLQDGSLYELRMYAENKFNKSSPTEIITIKTIKDWTLSSSEAVIGGVAGGLSAVIVILIIIILVLIVRKQGTRKQRSTAQTSRWEEETSFHNDIDCKKTDEQEDTQAETDKLKARSAQEYESFGMKDNPNTYSGLLTHQDTHNTRSAPEYETLGMTDSPNTYSELHNEQDQKQSDNTTDHYESFSDKDKSTVSPTTNAQLGAAHSEYSNIKI